MKSCRSTQDKIVAGVCGGSAEQLGSAPFRLRMVSVPGTIFTAFSGLIVYFGLWYLMPKGPLGFEPAIAQPWRHGA